jgi:hypothetical protein
MHRTSHRGLLVECAPAHKRRRVDALILPTYRPISFLSFGIGLARDLDCPILIMCSGQSRAAIVSQMLGATRGAAVTVSSSLPHPMLEMHTQRPQTWMSRPYVDTGNKRNVGLLIGRMLGWRRVLFLDDDVSGLDARGASMAAAHIVSGGKRVVGWSIPEFPDNSVACHALRSSGHDQDVFIGAGALLVDLTGPLPYFPSIYNEDWLFWHDFVIQGEIGIAGDVLQTPHEPFADPGRAQREEFGDVLAEGLYALIHERRSVLVGCMPTYWVGVINDRREMLLGTERRLWKLREHQGYTWNGYEIQQVLRSVDASKNALESISPADLAEFTTMWRYDLYCWRSRLHRLPHFGRITEALNWLGIRDVYLSGEI